MVFEKQSIYEDSKEEAFIEIILMDGRNESLLKESVSSAGINLNLLPPMDNLFYDRSESATDIILLDRDNISGNYDGPKTYLIIASINTFNYMQRLEIAETIRSNECKNRDNGSKVLFRSFAIITEAYLSYTEKLITKSKKS